MSHSLSLRIVAPLSGMDAAPDCLPQGILGLCASSFREYVQHIDDRRLERIGFLFHHHAPHPFPWLSETIDLGKEHIFFKTHVTEYQAASTLQRG